MAPMPIAAAGPLLRSAAACIVLLLLSACNVYLSEVDARATNYITQAIMAPEDKQALIEFANNDAGGVWIEDPPLRNTLRYLWARSEQGVELDVAVVERRPLDETQQVLIVEVTESGDSLMPRFGAKYLFALTFTKTKAGDWRMIALSLDR